MRKLSTLFAALLIAGSLGLAAAPAGADPSDACGSDPVATGTDGANSISVCVDGVGAVTAAQKGDTNGYIAADGDSGNPDPTDGYVAVSDKGVACSADGDFSYGDAECDPQP